MVDKFKNILREECRLYKDILEITTKKTETIKTNEIKELDKITRIEQTFIKKIGKLEEEREETVKNIRKEFNIDENADMSQIIERIGEEHKKEIETITSELMDILQKIKEKNDLNGMLIKDSLEFINLNVNLLTNATTQNTYGGKNTTGNMTQNRSMFEVKI